MWKTVYFIFIFMNLFFRQLVPEEVSLQKLWLSLSQKLSSNTLQKLAWSYWLKKLFLEEKSIFSYAIYKACFNNRKSDGIRCVEKRNRLNVPLWHSLGKNVQNTTIPCTIRYFRSLCLEIDQLRRRLVVKPWQLQFPLTRKWLYWHTV